MSDANLEEPAGKHLDVRSSLQYALAAASVLRSLQLTDRKMQYGQLAQAIGLTATSNGWKAWHRQQIAAILQLVKAAEIQAGDKSGALPIEFERIVGKDGQPGSGVTRDTRIVSKRQASQKRS